LAWTEDSASCSNGYRRRRNKGFVEELWKSIGKCCCSRFEKRPRNVTANGAIAPDARDASEDRELVSSLFRAAHTIKGNASLLEFNALARFLHNVEDLLDLCRSNIVALSQEVISILLQA